MVTLIWAPLSPLGLWVYLLLFLGLGDLGVTFSMLLFVEGYVSRNSTDADTRRCRNCLVFCTFFNTELLYIKKVTDTPSGTVYKVVVIDPIAHLSPIWAFEVTHSGRVYGIWVYPDIPNIVINIVTVRYFPEPCDEVIEEESDSDSE